MFDNKYPYTDYHEMNLDWFLGKFKELVETWEQVRSDWNSLHDYVQNYFDNLNVQTEINNKINAMIADGSFATIVTPLVEAALPAMVDGKLPAVVASQIGAVVAAQIDAVVAGQLPTVAAQAAADEVSAWLSANIDPDTGYVIDKSLTVSDAAADAAVTGSYIFMNTDSLFQNQLTTQFNIIVGGIGTAGNNNSNTARCRTDYIETKGGAFYRVTLNNASYRIVNAFIYDSNKSPIEGMTDKTNTYVNIRSAAAVYLRVSFSLIDNTQNITDSDITAITAALSINMISDVSLTKYDNPADAATVGYYTRSVIHDAVSLISWELGTIGSNVGADISSTTRIRSIGYTPFEYVGMIAYVNSGFKYTFRLYNSSFTYLGFTSFDGEKKMVNLDRFADIAYFRMVMAYDDDSEINAADVSTVASNLTLICSNADPTLTKPGYAAEAATVGELFNKYHNKTVKILGIGNSYTRDSFRWLCASLMDLGYNCICGHGYKGGITLQQQYESFDPDDDNHSAFKYWKYDNSKDATITSAQTLESIIKDEPWDIVIFQQQSNNSGKYESFVSESFDIKDLVDQVKTWINNPNLKIYFNATWSHPDENNSQEFIDWYNKSSATMYAAIEETIPRVCNYLGDVAGMINTGKAIQDARNNTYLGAMGTAMTRDLNHLCYGIPQYLSSLSIIDACFKENLTKLKFFPTSEDSADITEPSTQYLAFLAKQYAESGNRV